MHLYTSWLCNLAFGTFWAVIAFLTPPISDLIMCGVVIQQNGIFNPFIIEWVVVILLYTVPMLVLEHGGAKQIVHKVTFCRRCGSQLDDDRKCTGCGKQYFNNFKSFRKGIKSKFNVLSILCIVIICILTATISVQNSQIVNGKEKIALLENNIEKSDTRIKKMNKEKSHSDAEIARLINQLSDLNKKSKFFDAFVGITTESGTKFHKYDCNLINSNGSIDYNGGINFASI